MPQHSRRWALLALIFLSVIWGYNWVVMKAAMSYSPPFTFATLRTLIGAIPLLAVLLWQKKPLAPQAPGGLFLVGLFQGAGFAGFSCAALVTGGAGKTALLAFTMPFWTLLFAWPVLGEKVRGGQWISVGLSLAGMLCVLEPWNLSTPMPAKLLAIGAGITWALGAVIAKRLRQQVSIDLISLTAWQMVFGGLILLAIMLWADEGPVHWTPAFAAMLSYNIVLVTAIGWLIWIYILATLPAGTAGLSVLAIPLIGLLGSRWQLGEGASAAEIVGMVLIFSSLLVLAWRNRKG